LEYTTRTRKYVTKLVIQAFVLRFKLMKTCSRRRKFRNQDIDVYSQRWKWCFRFTFLRLKLYKRDWWFK